jgi:glycerophosphoryl diester phosphodiesterase
MPADRRPAISAHRGGSETAAPGTYRAYYYAMGAGADYLELDVRRTSDGILVVSHRARTPLLTAARARGQRAVRPVAAISYAQLCRAAGFEVPRLDRVLPLLAGRARLHLDVKDPGSAAEAAELALAALGPADIVATTRDLDVARLLARTLPQLPVGVAVGGDLAESARFLARRASQPGPSRLDAVAAAGASWAALHYRQAAAGLAAQCRARGIKTLVWTVNSDRALARWLASPDVDVLVTDRPARAVALRDGRASPAACPDRAARPGPAAGRP